MLQGSIPVNKFFDGVTITRFASAELRLFSTAALTCSRSGKRRTDLVPTIDSSSVFRASSWLANFRNLPSSSTPR